MLPEPIFVHGFIRRYGETLGLNGIELSQQFTVDSIPSTPRPVRPAPPGDTTTTRFAVNGHPKPNTAAAKASQTATPMFSAGVVANGSSPNTVDDLTLGRPDTSPFATAAASFDPALSADALLESTLEESALEESAQESTVNSTVNSVNRIRRNRVL